MLPATIANLRAGNLHYVSNEKTPLLQKLFDQTLRTPLLNYRPSAARLTHEMRAQAEPVLEQPEEA